MSCQCLDETLKAEFDENNPETQGSMETKFCTPLCFIKEGSTVWFLSWERVKRCHIIRGKPFLKFKKLGRWMTVKCLLL